MGLLDSLDGLLGIKRKPKDHKLKWKLPEERITFPVEDADQAVGWIKSKLHPRFTGGGEYFESVYAKQFGEGVYGYFLVRTDKKTEEETVVSEAYMLQEEDKLGVDVESGYKISQDFEKMGYAQAFQREYKVWSFRLLEMGITVFDLTDFGPVIEFSLPQTYFPKQREASEKKLFDAVEKLGLQKEAGVPTDAITLQMMEMQQAAQQAQEAANKPRVASVGKSKFKYGFGKKK